MLCLGGLVHVRGMYSEDKGYDVEGRGMMYEGRGEGREKGRNEE